MARILAVDDERAILDALARVLGRDGMRSSGRRTRRRSRGWTSRASTSCSATS